MPAIAGMTGGWMGRPDAVSVLCCFSMFSVVAIYWLRFGGNQLY